MHLHEHLLPVFAHNNTSLAHADSKLNGAKVLENNFTYS